MQEQLPRGVAVVAAFYKTLSVFCPSGQLKYSCSILLPEKLVWATLLGCSKRARKYDYGARGARYRNA